jgi:hypothetical protein
MLNLAYDYASCVRNSEKVAWRVDEVLPEGTKLDFSKRFLPAAISGPGLPFLAEDEARKLNQITGNAYLNIFAFVEEYIVRQVMGHTKDAIGDHHALRALTRFADEELKHQELFWRALKLFKEGFGSPCGLLEGAAAVAGVVLSKGQLGVMLVTYHLEIMTQAHYTESVRDDAALDPAFARILHHHWLEESQHARIDALELDRLLSQSSPEAIDLAFDEYLGLLDAIDGLLIAQARMDKDSFEAATSRRLSEEEAAALVAHQHAAYRRSFFVVGMRHPSFVEILGKISAAQARRISEKAASFDPRAS